jgi:RimJ/RimL family protein N-acetyltransferase
VTVLTSTDRIVLRQWSESDATPLFTICSEPDVSRYLGWDPTRVNDAQTLIRDFIQREEGLGVTTWAVTLKEPDELIGWCGYARTNAQWLNPEVVEIGWMLGTTWWGRGLATEAATAALAIGAQRIDRRRIISKCSEENRRSERVMERIGLVRVGLVRGHARTVLYRAAV